jgi:hypothetical protein
MFVRVTRGRFPTARYDEILRQTQEQLVPAVKRLPGFRSYRGGVDRAAGLLVAVSLWDTAEQAAGLAALRSAFDGLGIQFDTTEVYEIVAEA